MVLIYNLSNIHEYVCSFVWKIYLYGKPVANFARALPQHNYNQMLMLHEKTNSLVAIVAIWY